MGYKRDEVGYRPYRICQDNGALIVNGHEHSYARTRTLLDIGNRKGSHGVAGAPDELLLGPGSTAVVVSGLGGTGIRGYSSLFHADDSWWAAFVTSDRVMRSGKDERRVLTRGYSGALILDLGLANRANEGRGYFVLAETRQVLDRFTLRSVAPSSAR